MSRPGQLSSTAVLHYRRACAIELEEVVVLTGGVETLTRATVYTDAGFLRDLPPLNHERHNHGCGHYVNQDLDTVSNE